MNVVILDTGCANLASVTYAVRRLGYQPEVSRDPEIVLRADKLFLPGVGTAQAAMDQLRERDLIELIRPARSRCWAFASACSCWRPAAKRTAV